MPRPVSMVSRCDASMLCLALLLVGLLLVPDATARPDDAKAKPDRSDRQERQGPPSHRDDPHGNDPRTPPGKGRDKDPVPPPPAEQDDDTADAPDEPDRSATPEPVVPHKKNQPPVALFTHERDGPVLIVDALDAHDPDGAIVAYRWDWGDGTHTDGTDLEMHVYHDPLADHTVRLTVIDDQGATSRMETHLPGWDGPVIAQIDAWGDGATLLADGTASRADPFLIVDWHWDWGDGGEGTGPIAEHRYTTPGHYTVTLTVTDELGRTATTTHAVEVQGPAPAPVLFGGAVRAPMQTTTDAATVPAPGLAPVFASLFLLHALRRRTA